MEKFPYPLAYLNLGRTNLEFNSLDNWQKPFINPTYHNAGRPVSTDVRFHLIKKTLYRVVKHKSKTRLNIDVGFDNLVLADTAFSHILLQQPRRGPIGKCNKLRTPQKTFFQNNQVLCATHQEHSYSWS